jgi:hypothetical protein
MSSGNQGYVRQGAGLARRDWPALAWLYLVNLVLAALASAGLAAQFGSVLNTSLNAQRLAHGFDVTVFLELLLRPEVTPRVLVPVSVFAALVFGLVTVFLTAGIVQSFLSDEHLRTAGFFEACGKWFWRFFWLTLLDLIIFGIVLGVLNAVREALLDWAGKSPDPKLYFYVGLAALLALWVVAVFLRLWFDLAQFSLVHGGGFWRALPAGLRLLRQGCLRLFGIYFAITLVGWVGLAAGVWVWVKLPPAAVVRAFLVGQAILILWLATRYWQRAAEALWFRAHAPAAAIVEPTPPALEPVAVAPPVPAAQPALPS